MEKYTSKIGSLTSIIKWGLTASAIISLVFLVEKGCKNLSIPEPKFIVTKTTEAKRYYVERERDLTVRVYVDEKPYGSLDYVEFYNKRGNDPNNYTPRAIMRPDALTDRELINDFEKIREK